MTDHSGEIALPPRCGSKMCSEPHRAIFGRCHCVLPQGHVGVHSCGSDFYLSEFPAAHSGREAQR